MEKEWEGGRKRWDRIVGEGEGGVCKGWGCIECQVSAAICSNSKTPILPL